MHFSLAKSVVVALLGLGNLVPALPTEPARGDSVSALAKRKEVDIPQFKDWGYKTDKEEGEPDKYKVTWEGKELYKAEIYKDDKQIICEAANSHQDPREGRPKASLALMALFQMSALDKNDLKSLRLEAVVEESTKKAINEIAKKRKENEEELDDWEQKEGDDSFKKIMDTTWGKTAGYLGKEEGAKRVVEKLEIQKIDGEDEEDWDWNLEFFYKDE